MELFFQPWKRLCREWVLSFPKFFFPPGRIRAPRSARCQDPRPLFPGYAFVLIVLQWHAVKRTPGVVRLVTDGGVPAKVPDSVIAELHRRERNGLVQLPSYADSGPAIACA